MLKNVVVMIFSILFLIASVSSAKADNAQIFNNNNVNGVGSQPSAKTQFTLNTPYTITDISTYHWNNGRGATTGTIKLVDGNGKVYGPWNATGVDASGGVKKWFLEM